MLNKYGGILESVKWWELVKEMMIWMEKGKNEKMWTSKGAGGRRDDYLTELHKIMREDDEEWNVGSVVTLRPLLQ